MEKTYQLDQRESMLLQQIDQERTQALAAVGALSLDMETARKNLDAAAERQRGFLRQAVSARGVDRFEGARAQGSTLVVTVPDPPPLESFTPEVVNGPAAKHVKHQAAKE